MKTDIQKFTWLNSSSTRASSGDTFYQMFADSVSDAVIITDKHLVIEYWNKAASQVFDFINNDAIGNGFHDLLSSAYDIVFFESVLAKIAEHGKWEGQLITRKKQQLDCTFLYAAPDDEAPRLFITCKDNSLTKSLVGRKDHPSSSNAHPGENEFILSEHKLRSVLNNSIGAIFLLDTSFRVILANEKAKKIVRLAGNGLLLEEGIYFPDLLPEDRKAPVIKILDRVLHGEKVDYEIYYPKSTGRGIWLLANYTPVKDADRRTNQICITAYNITGLKENQLALSQSEQRWMFALEGAGDGVWEYNFETKEAYYSPLYKKMLGYSEEEFSNHAYEWKSKVHPDDLYKIIDVDTLYKDDSIVSHAVEYRLRSKSGEYIWVLDRGMLFGRTPDGKPLKLIGTHTNITERKIAEEKLKQSESRFTSFMANTPTMTWIIDEHGVFRYLNASYKKGFGLSEDAIGKSLYEFFPKNISDQFIKNNRWVFEMNQPLELTEEGIGPDGTKQVYHIYKFPLEPENGVRLIGGVALDITKNLQFERHLAEDETRKKRDIIQAIINAQEKERVELANELHDNVNQILSSSKLMLEVAAEKPGAAHDFINRGLAYLQEAIAEIRKISHNLTPASLRDISLEAAIEDLVQSINVSGKLKIIYSKKNDLPANFIEPEKQLAVLRIIQEQFNNILKHAHASEATISLIINDRLLSLKIVDNGHGFNPSATKRGLGLNNMFNRVEFYNGSVQFDSSPGQGCKLLITIPIKAT